MTSAENAERDTLGVAHASTASTPLPHPLPGLTENATRTRYFTNVLGVFQGGGVRGAALAGAYAAARSRGVRFSAVAGTSAGAIVAALVAAGASPEFLYRALTETDFKSFLKPPTKGDRIAAPSLGARVGRILAVPVVGWDEARAVSKSGAYSADGIQAWVEEQLRSVTGLSRIVLFRDLEIPLYVVAGDLRNRRVQVWNTSTHPEMSVALAARRSGSIPGFFQPSSDEHGVFVDGGLLSNLPAFVYKLGDAQEKIESSFSRVLAFRLRDDNRTAELTTPKDMILALVDTGIEANIDLQLQLQSDVHAVDIGTGTIKATDFKIITPEQRRWLWTSGAEAANKYLNDEVANVRVGERRHYNGFEEEMYLFTSFADEGKADITIVGETNFVFYAMPTLLHSAQDGLRLRVVTRPAAAPPSEATNEEKRAHRYELHQRMLLSELGATLDERDFIPWHGFIFRRGNRERRAVIADSSLYGPNAYAQRSITLYQDPDDTASIDVLEQSLSLPSVGTTPQLPKWVPCATEEWQSLMRLIRAYSNSSVTLAIEPVELASVSVLDRFVKEYRIPSARRMIRGFRERGQTLFDPYFIEFADRRRSLVTPPVFEVLPSGRVVAMEGITRCFLLLDDGETHVRGIVARNVDAPLPGKMHPLRRLRISSRTLTLEQNIADLDLRYFRSIEQDVHPFTESAPARNGQM